MLPFVPPLQIPFVSFLGEVEHGQHSGIFRSETGEIQKLMCPGKVLYH